MTKVYGIRAYVTTNRSKAEVDIPMFVHAPINEESKDIEVLFGQMSDLFRAYGFSDEYGITFGEESEEVARDIYGSNLIEVSGETQEVLLEGNYFEEWMSKSNIYEGSFHMLVNLNEPRVGWNRDVYYSLKSNNWPSWLRGVIHMWDDAYWEFYSTDKKLVDFFHNQHRNNPVIELFAVELDLDFPNPRNSKLDRYA